MERTRGFCCPALIIVLLAGLFFSCDSSGGGGSAGIPAAFAASELAGTWVFWNSGTAITYEGAPADSIVFEFDAGMNYEAVSYRQGYQAGGSRGSFSISGSTLVFASSENWNASAWDWSGPVGDPADLEITLGADSFAADIDGGERTFGREVFGNPVAVRNVWAVGGNALEIKPESAGVFPFQEYRGGGLPCTELGYWDASDGAVKFLRRVVTHSEEVEISPDISRGRLHIYSIHDGGTTLKTHNGTYEEVWTIGA